jgi:hypothetical protein
MKFILTNCKDKLSNSPVNYAFEKVCYLNHTDIIKLIVNNYYDAILATTIEIISKFINIDNYIYLLKKYNKYRKNLLLEYAMTSIHREVRNLANFLNTINEHKITNKIIFLA